MQGREYKKVQTKELGKEKRNKKTLATTVKQYKSFRYRLILEGIAVGAVTGIVVVAFRYLIGILQQVLPKILEFGKENAWFIPIWFLILMAAAMIVAKLLKFEPFISGSGIPQVEGEVMGEFDPSWWKVLFAKLAGGLISLGCGLSLGREGPSIQLGAMTAKGFSRTTKRTKTEERLLITCGASAGLAAAFNAPLAGILFSLEEIHRHFSPEVLLSTMASSLTADFVSRHIFGLSPVFDLKVTEMLPLEAYIYLIPVGVLLGLMGTLYNHTLSKTQDLYKKIPNATIKLVVPFALAGILGFLYPEVLGGGHSLVEELTDGNIMLGAICVLFAIKFLFSMISFGSGAPGGIFLPLLVMGALVGSIYFSAVGMVTDSIDGFIGNFVIFGMVGAFSAIVRAPITGIILISEMTGSFSHLLSLSVVALIAYLIPDLLKCMPVYDQLLHRLLAAQDAKKKKRLTGKHVLVEGMIFQGSAAAGLRIAEVKWPPTCLVIGIARGSEEFVPRGDTLLAAGDKLIILCDEAAQGNIHRVLQEHCQIAVEV